MVGGGGGPLRVSSCEQFVTAARHALIGRTHTSPAAATSELPDLTLVARVACKEPLDYHYDHGHTRAQISQGKTKLHLLQADGTPGVAVVVVVCPTGVRTSSSAR
jgi:hypothetical protein